MSDFTRLKEKRLPKTQKAIQLIGNLSTYKHEDAEAIEVVRALENEILKVRERFKLPSQPTTHETQQPSTTRALVDHGGSLPEQRSVIEDLKWAIDAMGYDKKMARELVSRSITTLMKLEDEKED